MDALNAVNSWYQAKYVAAMGPFESDLSFFIVSLSCAHGATLLLSSLGFLSLDKFPKLFDRYRLQTKEPPAALFWTAAKGLVFNSVVMYPLFAAALFPLTQSRIRVAGAMPDALTTLRQLFVCMLCDDCLFYWIHRLLHHPSVYAKVHKKHHEFKANRAPSAEYFHPVEDVLNVIPVLAGPLLQGMHHSTFLLWVCVVVNEIVDAHSGYGVWWSPWSWTRPSERHEYHHSHNIGCYGSYFPVWDYVMGTDAHFQKFMKNGAWRGAEAAKNAAGEAAPPPPPQNGRPAAAIAIPPAEVSPTGGAVRRNPGRACKSPIHYK